MLLHHELNAVLEMLLWIKHKVAPPSFSNQPITFSWICDVATEQRKGVADMLYQRLLLDGFIEPPTDASLPPDITTKGMEFIKTGGYQEL
jgi:hypothetical protein